MKTLAILSDFSIAARNAADLGMRLAVQLKLNLVLVTADSGTIDNENNNYNGGEALQNEVVRMSHHANVNADNSFTPAISPFLVNGSFDDLMSVFSADDVELILMGADTDARVFGSGKIQEVSMGFKKPVLFVPADYEDDDVKTVCFVTDLTATDINAAAYLQQITTQLDAQLFVGHISKPSFNMDAKEEMNIAAFMSDLEKLGFLNHQYQNVYNEDVAQGIELFCHNKRADILTLVNREHSAFWQLFHRSITDVLKTHQHLPILLMPELTS